MKTKEFIEKANKLGCKVEQSQMGTSVYNETNCCTMAMVSEDYENSVNITYASDELFDLIVSYAKTPVEERKSVKKYSVKLLPNSKGYLNVRYGYSNTVANRYLISDIEEMGDYKTVANRYSISDIEETNDYKTKFTEDEIEALKMQPGLAIDWDKVCIEPAV